MNFKQYSSRDRKLVEAGETKEETDSVEFTPLYFLHYVLFFDPVSS